MTDRTYSQTHGNYTMAEAARKLNFSRGCVYWLINQGMVFPPSVYFCRVRQPVYPARFVDVCAIIRKTRIGLNRQVVRFHRKRRKRQARPDLAIHRLIKKGALHPRKICGRLAFDIKELALIASVGDQKRERGRPQRFV